MLHHRRVIRIRAEDSPNVRLALTEKAMGREPSGRQVLPGVLSWAEYQNRRLTWDPVRQCVGLDAMFYEGAELLLFPPEWLNLAERRAEQLGRCSYGSEGLNGKQTRQAKAIGVDPAEGGDKTAICVVDMLGILELLSVKTPDTSVTPKQVMATMRKWGVPPERVCFDRGGGGKQHSDTVNMRLRDAGVRAKTWTVGFGDGMTLEPKRGLRVMEEKKENKAERYEYVNRRAQMYHELSLAIDPGLAEEGPRFSVPPGSWGQVYVNLRRQMAVVPKEYDEEGRLRLRPKHRKPGQQEQLHKTLTELVGHSPDELDALALAYHAATHKPFRPIAGAII